jgi:hypothetical protein
VGAAVRGQEIARRGHHPRRRRRAEAGRRFRRRGSAHRPPRGLTRAPGPAAREEATEHTPPSPGATTPIAWCASPPACTCTCEPCDALCIHTIPHREALLLCEAAWVASRLPPLTLCSGPTALLRELAWHSVRSTDAYGFRFPHECTLGGRSGNSRFGLKHCSEIKPSVWGEWRELSESHSTRARALTPCLHSLLLSVSTPRHGDGGEMALTPIAPPLSPRPSWQGSPAPSPSAHSVASSAATSASYNPIHDALDEAALRKAAACTTLGDVLASHVLDRIFLGCVATYPLNSNHALTLHLTGLQAPRGKGNTH